MSVIVGGQHMTTRSNARARARRLAHREYMEWWREFTDTVALSTQRSWRAQDYQVAGEFLWFVALGILAGYIVGLWTGVG